MICNASLHQRHFGHSTVYRPVILENPFCVSMISVTRSRDIVTSVHRRRLQKHYGLNRNRYFRNSYTYRHVRPALHYSFRFPFLKFSRSTSGDDTYIYIIIYIFFHESLNYSRDYVIRDRTTTSLRWRDNCLPVRRWSMWHARTINIKYAAWTLEETFFFSSSNSSYFLWR